ncbi:MAG: N-acetylneuraminate synthase family protein [Acidobacteriota bacterium]
MSEKRFTVGHVEIGEGLPCLLVAEIGLNHNGSLSLAHQHISAAALAGASMVKFQKRCPSELATAPFLDAPFPKSPLFGRTQREVRQRLEFSEVQLKELQEHAAELGLMFSMSVFDMPSLQAALNLKLPVLKIASHSITNAPLLEAAARSGVPIILSMGAATWEERDQAFEVLRDCELALLHCVSAYPCPDSLVKLDTIAELKRRYGRVTGYSGHETGVDVSVAAALLGASLIERHFTLNRSMVGLDHGMSVEPAEFAEMARRIRRVEKVRGVSEGIVYEELASRRNYHVSICTRRALSSGRVLRPSDLVCKQPLIDDRQYFTGLEIKHVVGRRLTRNLPADTPIPRDAVADGDEMAPLDRIGAYPVTAMRANGEGLRARGAK